MLSLVLAPRSSYPAGVNDIKEALNQNDISTPESAPIDDDAIKVKVIKPSTPAPESKSKLKTVKNISEAASENNLIAPPHGLYKYETIKVDNTSFVVKKPVAINPSKIERPSQKLEVKSEKPLRIGALKAPVRIDDIPEIPEMPNSTPAKPMNLVLKEFPADHMFPDNMSEDESAAVFLLKQMYQAVQEGTDEYLINSAYIKFTQKYPTYQYLSALARFYLEEYRLMRSNGYVYNETAYYEAYCQLSAMYSHEKNSKNKIYAFMLSKCEERKMQIEANNSELTRENKYIKWCLNPALLAETIKRIEEKEYFESPYISTVPGEKSFWVEYNYYLENYRKLIKNYLLMKNYSAASSAMADYENFYANSIKRFHVVKYYRYDSDTLLTKNIEVFRNAEEHLDFIRQYVSLVSYQGEVNADNAFVKSEIAKYVNKMEAYKRTEGNETVSGERISDEKLIAYNTHAASSSMYEENTYYRNEIKFVFSAFTRSEGLYQPEDEILDPRDTLKLWFVTDGQAPRHAIKMQISVKSSTSRREKSSVMEFKQDSLAPYYCAVFIPNETDSVVEPPPPMPSGPVTVMARAPLQIKNQTDRQKNLINNNRGSASKDNFIACFNAELYTKKLFNIYDTNLHFATNGNFNHMGYAIEKDYSEIVNGKVSINSEMFPFCAKPYEIKKYVITLPTENFLKKGGVELIEAQPGGATKLIKNQADWLIVDAHGSTSVPTGGVAWPDASGKAHRFHPYDLIDNGVSAYSEDLDVLILFTCHSLDWQYDKNSQTHSRGWQKALPEGIILGYQEASHDLANIDVMFLINNAIDYKTQKFTTKELSDMWFLANALVYKHYLLVKKIKRWEGYKCSGNAVTIYDKFWRAPILNTADEDSNLVTMRGNCPFNFRIYRSIYSSNTYYKFTDFCEQQNM